VRILEVLAKLNDIAKVGFVSSRANAMKHWQLTVQVI